MGGTSDRLKESAENLASERYENVKQAGERALDTTQAEASEHGPGKMQGSPGDEPTLVPDEPHLSEGERRGEPVNADRTPT